MKFGNVILASKTGMTVKTPTELWASAASKQSVDDVVVFHFHKTVVPAYLRHGLLLIHPSIHGTRKNNVSKQRVPKYLFVLRT